MALPGLVYFFVSRLTNSPVGRLLRSMRDDEVALQSLGRDTTQIKIKTLMIAGCIGAIGGLLYASYVEGVVAFGYNRLNWTFLPICYGYSWWHGKQQGSVTWHTSLCCTAKTDNFLQRLFCRVSPL